MASKAFMIALAVIAAVAVPALGKDFVVGDDNGWKNNNYDYKGWAQGKEFHVGDKLIFKYKEGAHNVYSVDQAGFKDCKSGENGKHWTTGNDEIELKETGKKWYICTIGNHCESGGMKLVIDVSAQVGAPAQPPASPPPSAASDIVPSKFVAWSFAALCILLMFVA